METEVILQIILIKPTKDVDFGLQKGSGNNYETIQKQRSDGHDLLFKFSVKVKGERQKDLLPKFSGYFVQGPATNKFIYIDIGTYAGQTNTGWSRRLKIPLTGITWKDIDMLISNPEFILETTVPGTGRDGGPNCATVKPFAGWLLKQL
jgi:Family of unknown function (DUF5990)